MSEEVLNHVFELIGPRAGTTVGLGGGPRGKPKYNFVNGRYSRMGTANGLVGLKRILALSHNAHCPGSPEHTRAVAEWAANPKNPANLAKLKGDADGDRVVPTPTPTGKAVKVPGNVQSPGAGAQAPKADVESTDNATDLSRKPSKASPQS